MPSSTGEAIGASDTGCRSSVVAGPNLGALITSVPISCFTCRVFVGASISAVRCPNLRALIVCGVGAVRCPILRALIVSCFTCRVFVGASCVLPVHAAA